MNLEYLRHGKALCGKVFRRFVETFNFHNDFITNLKGDADLQVVGGRVSIDRSDERHPVIRCQGCKDEGAVEMMTGCCNFSYDTENHIIRAGIFFSGRTVVEVSELDIGEEYTGKAYLAVDMTNESGELVAGDWNTTPTDTEMHVPLYEFEEGAIIADYRGAPTVQRWE